MRRLETGVGQTYREERTWRHTVVSSDPIVYTYSSETWLMANGVRGIKPHILRAMVSSNVICMMARVNILTSMRYTTDSRTAHAVTRSSRYTVLWFKTNGVPEFCPPSPPPKPLLATQVCRTTAERATKPRN